MIHYQLTSLGALIALTSLPGILKKNNTVHQTKTKRKTYTTSSDWQEYTFEGTPVGPNDIYKIKLIYKQNKLTLNRYNKGKFIDSYEVLGYSERPFDNNKKRPVITLVRQ